MEHWSQSNCYSVTPNLKFTLGAVNLNALTLTLYRFASIEPEC
jgi:hypothetical protein